jgi:hypothetical protein
MYNGIGADFMRDINAMQNADLADDSTFGKQRSSVRSDEAVSRSALRRVGVQIEVQSNLLKTDGHILETPSVPRKSRSPSARIVASRNEMPRAVATARNVTPAHPTSASSNMSAEHALLPIATGRRMKTGFNARFSGFDFARHVFADSSLGLSVTNAVSGRSRYCAFSGACNDFSSSAVIIFIFTCSDGISKMK